MSTYEERRLEKIKRNQELLNELGIEQKRNVASKPKAPPSKKRKLNPSFTPQATRSSARIATAPKPSYNDDERLPSITTGSTRKTKTKPTTSPPSLPKQEDSTPPPDLATQISSWTTWTPTADPPTRDSHGTYHFPSHPLFQPNKSPSEILALGAFGGTYYRPVYSKTLHTTIRDDYLSDLPPSWLSTLDPPTQLLQETYDPEINKYKAKCGQSIEEWEAAGWINYAVDARGWFQWYVRFFRGRRCEDDERQVGRWNRCCGARGRWRRSLLKSYLKKGVRSVADEGDGEEEEVSPVLHQTCLHWAWELRQDELDRVWEEGLG
ncbi:hypothetical protein MBLNU457_3107t1 [Dothideomycetes sp. NU457]